MNTGFQNTLKVGDVVSVARTGSYSIQSQGLYRVVKANKVKIVVARESDGYIREFSARRNAELSVTSSAYSYAFLEPVIDSMNRAARIQEQQARNNAWKSAEKAAQNKDIAQLRAALADLESLV